MIPRPRLSPAAAAAAAALLHSPAGAARPLHEPPPLERIVRVVEPSSDARLSLDELVSRLARADVVFLGETHLDETTHRLELDLLRRVVAARDGRVTLSLEMLARDDQDDVDLWLAGEIDDEELGRRATLWGNHRTAYAPLLDLARREGLPVVAANAPRSVVRALAFGGSGLDGLEPELRELAPEKLLPSSDEYWARADNATRGHRGMAAATTPEQRLTSTQSLWDNTMAESIARALERRPDGLVVHVNGGFHSAWRDGTVAQLRARSPEASIATVSIAPVRDPDAVDVTRLSESADFVALVGRVASEPEEGLWSVAMDRDARYALHLPASASAETPAPLLIWLPDDGVPPDAAMELWRARLGEEAAIAVVEPLHRERGGDLTLAGRWLWPDRARHDLSDGVSAVTSTWAAILRQQPVDPDRVLVAGRGSGATVAAAAAALSTGWRGRALAFEPSGTSLLRELPLVRPESRVEPPGTSLRVLAAADEEEEWRAEAAEHAGVGLDTTVAASPRDPWRRAGALPEAVRSELDLAVLPAGSRGRHHVALPSDTPLARTWGERLAAEQPGPVAVLSPAEAAALGAESLAGSKPIDLAVTPEALGADGALPRAPGPFGGTTVVVLPHEPEDLAPWTALEEDDPLARRSRFHRVRIATLDGERHVANVLRTLRSENRRNVLIVPAVFAAPADLMRRIEAAAEDAADGMELHWRPGLGPAAVSHGPNAAADGAPPRE